VGDQPQYAPGQQLAGTVYRVVRHLATGGMGSVYDVEDVTVGKRYVLKTLHPQLVSRHDLAKRMEAEARALAKLQHPNIVDVVTAGMTTDEQRMPFYVMERLNGQNLRVVIEKKGSLELSHCFRIAIDVLDALEHAHENSIIHRDVKPENIFLHRNINGTTITKLLDFGIMRLLDRKMSHTQGKFIGTLRYASPEQIFGGDLGPQTDIYSLGIVLYEMLAGRGPFDEVGDAYAIGAAHAQRPPPPLSQFVALPPALERLVMASLAKAPQDRPRDCFSFASELRRMLRDEEAAPKSATQVNVLSSVPATRAVVALAGTEPAQPARAVTDVGMMPPSALDRSVPIELRGLRATLPLGSERPPGMSPPGPVASPLGSEGLGRDGARVGATALGHAATLASEPGGAQISDAGSAKPKVDRGAETRASGAAGFTQRLAQNGTAIDDGPPLPLLGDDAVRAALAQHEPLELPPTSAGPHDTGNGELVFPKVSAYSTGTGSGTGPLAGEARTRPPSARGMLLPLFAAAAVGALLVGGAVLLVVRPWEKHASGTPAPSPVIATAASAPPSIAPLPVTPPPAPSPQATAAATSVPATEPSSRPVSRAPVRSVPPRPEVPPVPVATPTASTARKPPRPAPSGAPAPSQIPFE
jgi:serine/threonine protein kinase